MLSVGTGVMARLGRGDWRQLTAWREDERRMRKPDVPVQRPSLAGRADRFVVHVVCGRTTGIEVRVIADTRLSLAQAAEAERELRQYREDGRSSHEDRPMRGWCRLVHRHSSLRCPRALRQSRGRCQHSIDRFSARPRESAPQRLKHAKYRLELEWLGDERPAGRRQELLQVLAHDIAGEEHHAAGELWLIALPVRGRARPAFRSGRGRGITRYSTCRLRAGDARTAFLLTDSPASIEFDARSWLLCADPSSADLRLRVILAAHRSARHPPQHGELSRVRQRVRHRALKQSLDARA